MSLLNLLKNDKFFDVPDANSGSGSGLADGELTPDKIAEFFSQEDPGDENETIDLDSGKEKDKAGKKSTKETSGKEESTEEDDEDEKSLEDELEEELSEEKKLEEDDLDTVYHTRKQILAKYPQLFKDFPGLQRAYYREQKYAEILPSLEDAERAVEDSTLLRNYGKDIANGSLKSILKDSREANPEAFALIADNYLSDLHSVDQNAYNHVFGNVVAITIRTMINQAKGSSDEDERDRLVAAAKIVTKVIFGNDNDIPEVRRMAASSSREKNERESEIEERERRLIEREQSKHVDALESKVGNIIKSTLDKFIDPYERMSDYVRSNAVRDAQSELDKALTDDVRFVKTVQKLWERAEQDDYSNESLERIKEAIVNKSRVLLPEIIKGVRNKALKGSGNNRSSNDSDSSSKKGPLPVGQSRRTAANSNSGGKTNTEKAKEIPKGMSTRDFFNQD